MADQVGDARVEDGDARWCTVLVRGQRVPYLVGGQGPDGGSVVVFLHGWGLGPASYRAVVAPLARRGVRVLAPALPGFVGCPRLPAAQLSLPGYAEWVVAFLDALEVTAPVTLVGHSFGGGVAICVAHQAGSRVARLVLVNSIGGASWRDHGGRTLLLAERPLWDWGLHLQADLTLWGAMTRVLPVVLADALTNALFHPWAVVTVAHLAWSADLGAQLEELTHRRLPVVVLWGRHDQVLPRASLAALQLALPRAEVRLVEGDHSWLLADPTMFTEVITNVLVPDLPAALAPAAGLLELVPRSGGAGDSTGTDDTTDGDSEDDGCDVADGDTAADTGATRRGRREGA